MEEKMVKKCEQYVKEHLLYEKVTLDNMAHALGYNSSYMSRRFRSATGMKLMDYYRNKKIEMATELLETGMNVIDVAMHLEYSKNGFTKAYKKYTGINPSCVYKKTKGEE